MLKRMPSRLLSEWMAFDRLDPIGERRRDLQAGVVASTVANANRDTKKRREPFRPDEFVLKFEEAQAGDEEEDEDEFPNRQTWQEKLAVVEMLNAALGGEDLRKKTPVS